MLPGRTGFALCRGTPYSSNTDRSLCYWLAAL